MENEKHVYKALLEVSKGLVEKGIAKSSYNEANKYVFRSIEAFYEALSPLLASNNLLVITKKEEFVSEQSLGRQRLVVLKMYYQIIDITDGSTLEFESLGEGADITDKAIGKAKSYAYKTAMEKLFCIPMAGQDDPDKSNGEERQGQSLETKKQPQQQVKTWSPNEEQALREEANIAVNKGANAYHTFWRELPDEAKRHMVDTGIHAECKAKLGL